MKLDKKMLAILVIAAVFVAAAAMGIMKLRTPVPTQNRVQTIKVQPAGRVQKENALELTGSIEAVQNAVVSGKTAGRVSEIAVENGNRVAVGDVLVKVEDIDYINQLAASQAVLDKALTNLASLTQDYNRGKTLFQAEAISQKAMDDLENGLKAARADVAAAEASVANAREALAGTSIRAPIAGLVANRNIKMGQMLAAGTPLLLVEDLSEIFVLVKVGQKELDYIKTGLDCSVWVDTYPDQKFTGRVMVINPVAEAGSRVFECKVKVQNPDELLKPGMFARVSLKIGADQQVVAVPLEALSSKQGLYYVLVPEGDVVREKKVEIGALMGTMVEIKAGLTEGQNIVVSNVNKLKDGDHIQISSGQGG
ncbi:MAG: efflux RND transporter periplasmic adaptor subunit [Syntrophomonadaceae bacterium]